MNSGCGSLYAAAGYRGLRGSLPLDRFLRTHNSPQSARGTFDVLQRPEIDKPVGEDCEKIYSLSIDPCDHTFCLYNSGSVIDRHMEIDRVWSAESPTPAVADVDASLTFSDDGNVSGSGGCNSLGGEYTLEDNQITFARAHFHPDGLR